MTKKKNKKTNNYEIKLSKRNKLLLQFVTGIISGLVLSAIFSMFLSWNNEILNTFFEVFLVSTTIFFVYPIGVFLGVYFIGKAVNAKGSFWSSISGLLVSTIIFLLMLGFADTQFWTFWTVNIMIYPLMITAGYYRFGIKYK